MIIIIVLVVVFLAALVIGIVLIIYCKKQADKVQTFNKGEASKDPSMMRLAAESSTPHGPSARANLALDEDYQELIKTPEYQRQLQTYFGRTDVTP